MTDTELEPDVSSAHGRTSSTPYFYDPAHPRRERLRVRSGTPNLERANLDGDETRRRLRVGSGRRLGVSARRELQPAAAKGVRVS
jgi:hypothetical protein